MQPKMCNIATYFVFQNRDLSRVPNEESNAEMQPLKIDPSISRPPAESVAESRTIPLTSIELFGSYHGTEGGRAGGWAVWIENDAVAWVQNILAVPIP